MIMNVLLIVMFFIWGYFAGKPAGMKEGYRNCHRDLLKAKLEGRTHIGSSFDDFLKTEHIKIDEKEIRKRLNTVYDGVYESEEL